MHRRPPAPPWRGGAISHPHSRGGHRCGGCAGADGRRDRAATPNPMAGNRTSHRPLPPPLFLSPWIAHAGRWQLLGHNAGGARPSAPPWLRNSVLPRQVRAPGRRRQQCQRRGPPPSPAVSGNRRGGGPPRSGLRGGSEASERDSAEVGGGIGHAWSRTGAGGCRGWGAGFAPLVANSVER